MYRTSDIENHLAWAILATIFCCQPLGIVAIVYAAQANAHLAAGKYEEALQASTSARNWCLAATLSVVIPFFLYFLFFIAGASL